MNKEKELLFNIKFNKLINIEYIYENILKKFCSNNTFSGKYYFKNFFKIIYNIFNIYNNYKLNLLNQKLLIIDIAKYKKYTNIYYYKHNYFYINLYIDLKYFKIIFKRNSGDCKIIINNNFIIYYFWYNFIKKIKKKYNDLIIYKIYRNFYVYINKYIKKYKYYI